MSPNPETIPILIGLLNKINSKLIPNILFIIFMLKFYIFFNLCFFECLIPTQNINLKFANYY